MYIQMLKMNIIVFHYECSIKVVLTVLLEPYMLDLSMHIPLLHLCGINVSFLSFISEEVSGTQGNHPVKYTHRSGGVKDLWY